MASLRQVMNKETFINTRSHYQLVVGLLKLTLSIKSERADYVPICLYSRNLNVIVLQSFHEITVRLLIEYDGMNRIQSGYPGERSHTKLAGICEQNNLVGDADHFLFQPGLQFIGFA